VSGDGLVAVGVLADFWARDTGHAKEQPLNFAGDWTAEDIARYASTEDIDDGCVNFWPSVGGQVEVREADGTVVAVYRGGRRFGPAKLAAAEARLAAPAPPAPLVEQAARAVAEATGLDQIAEMGKVLAGFVLVERARGVVVSLAAYREHALRLGTEAAADSAIEYAAVWLGMHDGRRDGGGPCGCYPECKIPAARP
jgi:hypothetical protein